MIHFEIPTEEPERAVRFYQEVFGWKIEKWAGPVDYWLVTASEGSERGIDGTAAPGINGAIHGNETFSRVVNTIAVASVDEFLKKIERSGGKVLMPKGAVPSRGYVAFAEDTEGNAFGLFQYDPDAR